MENVNYAVPAIARDIGRKKRANRSAKLKQCKLDAKREQWLSQVKGNECKCENIPASPTSPFQHTSHSKSTKRERSRQAALTPLEQEETTTQENNNSDSPKHNDNNIPSKNGMNTITSSSSSSGSSTGSYSRSVSDDEEDDEGEDVSNENDGDGLDDWETIADALSLSSNNEVEPKFVNDNVCPTVERTSDTTKYQPEPTAPRAWRPDDVLRPQTLPNLSKHMSFPLERHHKLRGIPSSCPICYEDLDLTDSSFLPCECGFHICLFCHKRILEDDARCPGCRKLYNSKPSSEEIGIVTGVGAPALVYRISRSCSMSSK